LFRAARPAPAAPTQKSPPVEEMLRDVRPDELSPRDALELLYRLRSLLSD
jgi:DNA mismatch repair protein MutS